MKKLSLFQLIGPVAVFGALLAAEAFANALERAPSSEWLWFVNLKVFGIFQESHYALRVLLRRDYEQLVWIGAPLLAAAGLGVALRRSLLLAISSNLSFVYILFVFLAWFHTKAPMEASLSAQFAASSNSELIVLVALAALSLLSVIVSQIAFLQKAVAEAR